MTSNGTKNGLFRPWDEVRDSETISTTLSSDRDHVDSSLNLNYLRIDVKCERPERDEDDASDRESLSPSPEVPSSESSGNVNDVDEEENSLHKLSALVDQTILGPPNSDKPNSVDSNSSCSETSFSTSSPAADDIHSQRSAFVPTRLGHTSAYGFPGVSYPGVNQQHFDTAAGRLQLHQEIIARQEHAVFDHFAAQQGHLALEEAARLLQHHEAIVKQNKKLRPKKFLCPHCEVAFSNNGQLKGHIRIHTGERPFKCDDEGCGKTFTRNEELTRHKRIHSGVRPHACPICGKSFGRKDHLKKHARTHEMRGPAIYIPAPGPFQFPVAHPPLHPFIFGL